MSTAVATAVEIVRLEPMSHRADRIFTVLEAASQAAGVSVQRTTTYRGDAPWLMLWGPGDPAREAVLRRHVAAGGRVLCWDLAYWDRQHKARVSIDHAHPAAWVMRRDWPRDRFARDLMLVKDQWKPEGPIVVAGLGDKARVQYGAQAVDAWEASMIAACRARWPGRAVVYRKKKAGSPTPSGVHVVSLQSLIDEVLRGASLVVTWHSNVAVDAIRLGIPVICRDGAAAAVCPSEFGAQDPQPLPVALRDRFLANLAWFQWEASPADATAFWGWAKEILA